LLSKRFELINFIFLFLLLIPLSGLARGESVIDGVKLGIYEKGPFFSVLSNKSDNQRLELGIHSINIQLGEFDSGMSKLIPVNLSSSGIRFSYASLFGKSQNINRTYLKLGFDFSNIEAYSKVELSTLNYEFNGLNTTCSSCSSIEFKTSNKSMRLIPHLSLGWVKRISRNLEMDASLGIQYIDLAQVEWNYNSQNNLPKFVRDEINEAVKIMNSSISDLPDFYPTFLVSFTYLFS